MSKDEYVKITPVKLKDGVKIDDFDPNYKPRIITGEICFFCKHVEALRIEGKNKFRCRLKSHRSDLIAWDKTATSWCDKWESRYKE